MTPKTLGIVSTPYHLIVFLYLKESLLKDHIVDLVVTDKTQFMEETYHKGGFDRFFHKVYFADARKIKNPYKGAFTTLLESMVYNPTTKTFLDKPLDTYDHVYFASPGMPDEIVKELAKSLILKNRQVTFSRFEDGFASYTKPPVHVVSSASGQTLYQKLKRFDVAKQEQTLYLFEPALAELDIGKSGFTLTRIERDKQLTERVITMMKQMLDFAPKTLPGDVVFLGQGTANGAGNVDTYQKLIYEIAEKVGARFCMKPHPRGVNDRLGDSIAYYLDDCPFELACANKTFEDCTLISYYSTACASGSILFGSQAKVIFLYPLAEDAFNEKCAYEHYFKTLTALYPNIHIAHSKEELWALLDA